MQINLPSHPSLPAATHQDNAVPFKELKRDVTWLKKTPSLASVFLYPGWLLLNEALMLGALLGATF